MLLDGIIGQERARAQLEAEMASGRLAHAYLFVGPSGVGRGTTARALFMALVCQSPREGAACGQCGPCRRALAWQHEDLLVLEPPAGSASGQIKVESVREVIRALGFAPHGGAWRMVLIRQAQQLGLSSANALLKTLEEPPPGNIIVLTAHDQRDILPTLVSRCRKVSFVPLLQERIRQALVSQGADADEAAMAAALSGGSLGRALGLDRQAASRALNELLAALADTGGPLADWNAADEFMRRFRGGVIDRQGAAAMLDLLCLHLRDRAVVAAGRPQMAVMGQGGAALAVDRAALGFELVRRAQKQLLANAAPELVLTVLLQNLRAGLSRAGD